MSQTEDKDYSPEEVQGLERKKKALILLTEIKNQLVELAKP